MGVDGSCRSRPFAYQANAMTDIASLQSQAIDAIGAARTLDALEAQLADQDFILGFYSVADMAMYPLVAQQAGKLGAYPNITQWVMRMSLRPAVGRGMGAVSR